MGEIHDVGCYSASRFLGLIMTSKIANMGAVIVVASLIGLTSFFASDNSADEDRDKELADTSAGMNQVRYDVLREEVIELTRVNRWDEVVRICGQLVAWTQDDVEVWHWLGYGHLVEGDYDRAVAVWMTATRFDRYRFNCLYNLSCAQGNAGHTEEAIATFRQLMNEGYGDFDKVDADEDFFCLRGEPEFEAMLDVLARRFSFR